MAKAFNHRKYILASLFTAMLWAADSLAETAMPEGDKSSGGSESTVDLSTGDMSLSIPILKVPGRNGLDYDVSLSYSAGITLNQEASWVGLGWNLAPGSISRSITGIPDDYNGSAFCQYKFPSRPSFLETLVGEMVAPAAKGWLISSFIPGGPVVGTAMKVYQAASIARQIAKDGLAPTLIGVAHGMIPGSSYFSAATRIGFMAIPVESGESPANCPTYGSSVNRQGFLRNPTYWENYDKNGDPLADGGRPDIWTISGIPGGGRMVIANRNNFGRITGMSDAKFFLQNTASPQGVNIEFVSSTYGIDYFVVTFPNGTRFIYGDPSIPASQDYVHEQGSHTRLISDPNNVFFKTSLSSRYTSSWKLTAILSHDYIDGNGDVNPRNSTANNKGNWIAFDYVTSSAGFNFADTQSYTGSNPATNFPVWSQSGAKDLNESISGGVRSDSYLSHIYSPTHRVDFSTSVRQDGRSPEQSTSFPSSWPGVWPRKLDRIDLVSTTSGGGLVSSVRFNKDAAGSDLPVATQYALAKSAPGSVQGLGKYTLAQIQTVGFAGTATPPIKFTYGYGSASFNPDWQAQAHDSWGLYLVNGNILGNHNGATIYSGVFGSAGTQFAAAWSLTKVGWPTGSTSEWEFEIDDWFVGPYDFEAPREGKYTNYYDGGSSAESNFGGGLRVKKQQECDGLGNCRVREFGFTRTASVHLASTSLSTATISSGEASVLPAAINFDASQGLNDHPPRDMRRGGHRGSMQVLGDIRYSRVVETLSEKSGTQTWSRGSIEHKFLTVNSNDLNTNFAVDRPLYDGIAPGFKEDQPGLECYENFSGNPAWHGIPEACMGVVDLNWMRNAEYETTMFDASGNVLESTHRTFAPTEHFRWYFGDWELAPGAEMGFGFSSGWLKPTQTVVTKGSRLLTINFTFDGIYSQLSKKEEWEQGGVTRVSFFTYTSPRGELYETWMNDGTTSARNQFHKIEYETLSDGRTYPKRDVDSSGVWKSQVTAWDIYGHPTTVEMNNGLGNPVQIVTSFLSRTNYSLVDRVTKTLPGGATRYTETTYDDRTYLPVTTRSENGTTVSRTYDDLGRVGTFTDAAGVATTFSYDYALDHHSGLARNCSVPTNLNRTITEVSVGGQTRTTETSTDGLGRVVRTKEMAPDATTWKDTVFTGGEVKAYESSDSCGTTGVAFASQTFEASPLRREYRSYPDGSNAALYGEKTYAGPLVTFAKDPRGNTTTTSLDIFGNESQIDGPSVSGLALGQPAFKVTRQYDYAGNLTLESLNDTTAATGHTGNKVTRFAYDSDGRRIGAEFPDADYPPSSDDGTCTASALSNCDTQWRYDALDRVVASSTAEQRARGLEVCFYYDSLNRITLSQTQTAGSCGSDSSPSSWSGDNHTMSWVKTQFDSYPTGCGNYLPCQVPSGAQANPIGLVTYRESHWENEYFFYDGVGRLVKRSVNVRKGGSGNWSGWHVIEYVYNETGELTRKKVRTPFNTFSVKSDTQYAVNGIGRVTAISHNGTTLISNIAFSPEGRVEGFSRSNGMASEFTYDSVNRIESEALRNLSSGSSVFERRYTYDLAGNLTQVRKGLTPSSPILGQYAYDQDNQIRSAEMNVMLGALDGQSFKQEWDYDAAGNRLEQRSWSRSPTGSWGNFKQDFYSIQSGSSRLTAMNQISYRYDADGNVIERCANATCTSDFDYNYTYDSAGRLIRHRMGVSTEEVNYFGSDEKRVYREKQGGGKTLYIWDGDEVIFEEELNSDYYGKCGDTDGNGLVTISDAVYLINYIFASGPAPRVGISGPCAGDADGSHTITISDAVSLINYIFSDGSAPASISQHEQRFYVSGLGKKQYVHTIENPTSYMPPQSGKFYLTDLIGSTAYVMDGSGGSVAQYVYYPFGSTLARVEVKPEARTFHGREKEFHSSQEVFYYGARFYDPQLGRFLQRDTKDGELPYAYVENNPLTVMDPDGHAVLGDGLNIPDPVPQTWDGLDHNKWRLAMVGITRAIQQTSVGYSGSKLDVSIAKFDPVNLSFAANYYGVGFKLELTKWGSSRSPLEQGIVVASGAAWSGMKSALRFVGLGKKPRASSVQKVARPKNAPLFSAPFELSVGVYGDGPYLSHLVGGNGTYRRLTWQFSLAIPLGGTGTPPISWMDK